MIISFYGNFSDLLSNLQFSNYIYQRLTTGKIVMKNIILKLIEISLIILVVILFLFLFVDCKMEGEKLRLQASLLRDENEKLRVESGELQKHFERSFISLLEQKKIQVEDLMSVLTDKEIENIQNLIDAK
jgi:hypothetical protein